MRKRTQCADVRHDAGLIVGGAAAVEAAITHGWLERGRQPLVIAPGRLHVMVRVQKDCGAPLSGSARRQDGRTATLARVANWRIGHPHTVEQTSAFGEGRDGRCAALHLRLIE